MPSQAPPKVPAERRKSRLPGLLPVLYLALAHLSLLVAFGEVAFEPHRVTGFFYHPRMIAVVHLVTLGWISGSILGALHLVGPMALRAPMPARKIDYLAFTAYALGGSGIISHFWIEELSGVVWSGLLVTLVFFHVGNKFLESLNSSTAVPAEIRLHFTLAFANIALAAIVGTLLALNKYLPFLPGRAYTHAFAHAHIAVLGWATMMVFAAGYRLLPMFLPAAMPRGISVWMGAIIFELGVVGLFFSFLAGGRWLPFTASLTVVGISFFFGHLIWMSRHRKPPPKALKRPDVGVAQALSAFAYLAITCGLGLLLAFSPETTERTLQLTMIYGVCGLIGFLSQIIVGISARLLPIFARLIAGDWSATPPTPHELPDRRWQIANFVLWTLGVPVLAAGFWLNRTDVVSAGGFLLFSAVLANAVSQVVLIRAVRHVAINAT